MPQEFDPAMRFDPGRMALPPHALFWPMLVLIVSLVIFSIYQIESLEYELANTHHAIEKVIIKAGKARYARTKLQALGHDLLKLSPKDAKAQQIATEFKLQDLMATHPELIDTNPDALPAK